MVWSSVSGIVLMEITAEFKAVQEPGPSREGMEPLQAPEEMVHVLDLEPNESDIAHGNLCLLIVVFHSCCSI